MYCECTASVLRVYWDSNHVTRQSISVSTQPTNMSSPPSTEQATPPAPEVACSPKSDPPTIDLGKIQPGEFDPNGKPSGHYWPSPTVAHLEDPRGRHKVGKSRSSHYTSILRISPRASAQVSWRDGPQDLNKIGTHICIKPNCGHILSLNNNPNISRGNP